jgi:outer membrane protein assembly factor BamB
MRAARLLAATIALGGTLAATATATATATQLAAPTARADEVTISQNALRDGWDQNEPGLTPAALKSGSFGQLFDTKVNGQVYAQPLAVDDQATGTSSVIVATENDWVYSLDGQTGTVNWSLDLGQPEPSSVTGCADLTPNIGITSTPCTTRRPAPCT